MWELIVGVVTAACAVAGTWVVVRARRPLPANPHIVSVGVAIADMTSPGEDKVTLDIKVINNGGGNAHLTALELQIDRIVAAPVWDPIAPSVAWLTLRGAIEPTAKYDLMLPTVLDTVGRAVQVDIFHELKSGEGDRFVVTLGTLERHPNRLVYVADVSAVYGSKQKTTDGPRVGLGFGMTGDPTRFPVADPDQSAPNADQSLTSLSLNQRAAARDVEADVALLLRDVPRLRAAIDKEIAVASKPAINWGDARARSLAAQDLVPWLISQGMAEASSRTVWAPRDFVRERLDDFETRCRAFLAIVNGALLDPCLDEHLQYVKTSLVGIEAARGLLDASPRRSEG
ncbi:hypothetical protein [Promicromonospora sp. NFX87]|uniref:hypothetical protein n=1 Tax=Promicromonospora sp. NFX87 TaxID=3402691 RepID=UPI003AFA1B9A